jgi:methylenetetrahydrofolate dehydrogenase (NADP+)/methenyltetrahydrofolate cyclohydrolase
MSFMKEATATITPLEAVAREIDGKAMAAQLRDRVVTGAAELIAGGITPGLAVVLVGDDPASGIYVRNKQRGAQKAGLASFRHNLPASTGEATLLALIAKLNTDPTVHGILVQLPLPPTINENRVLRAIHPTKDVDGFHPYNVGLLHGGEHLDSILVPCTPRGCLDLLRAVHPDGLSGSRALVVGRSNIVGTPMAALLLRDNCTVTIAHSRTRDLADRIAEADILVTAVGRPGMVHGAWIKPGATVVDVGITRAERPDGTTYLTGDVEYAAARHRAGALTPVPGGVGPMTIAGLLRNTVQAARLQAGSEPDPALFAPLPLECRG